MALFSLALLLAAVVLGFVMHMNPGLVCIAFSLILGRMSGLTDKAIISGFNYSLFIILLGVTYLFSLAQCNGTLDLLAKKAVALAGKRTWLVPIIVYCFSVFLAAIGPGCVPVIAIMMVFSMALAAEMKIQPAMLAALVVLGASGGGVSPLAPTGIIGYNLCTDAGISGPLAEAFLFNGILSTTAYAAVVYIMFKGYALRSEKVLKLSDVPAFNAKQWITIAGIAAMVIMVMFCKFNVGLTSFLVAAVLSLLRVGNESEAILKLPWGTLLLIGGVSMLMSIITKNGGVKLVADTLAAIMTPDTAISFVSMSAGCLSWVSSTSGLVMPTMIPTVPSIVQAMGANINPLEMATSLSMVSHTAGISPMSTGGSLALAAYSSMAHCNGEEQSQLFLRLFITSALGIVFLCICGYFGLFHIFFAIH